MAMQYPAVQIKHIPLRGGMDQSTPPIQADPGTLRDSINFEVNVLGGYRRIDGYEKWDGQQLCNTHGYFTMGATIVAAIDEGRTIIGATSGATGYVLGSTLQYIYYVPLAGQFLLGEHINLLGALVATVTNEPYQRIDRSTAESAALMAKSANIHRQSIQTVPGSGKIRGLQYFGGSLYAFRDTADGAAMGLYKSSATGWVSVPFGTSVEFTGASGNLVDGAVLTKGGVTATIRRVVIRSGTLGSSTAAGTLVITTPAGGNFSAGAATVPGGALTLSGAQAAQTHAPGGRVRAVLSNFGQGQKMYWCSGVDYAYEFDGSVMAPSATGMANDRPAFLHVHKNHLFLAFANSLQNSGIGNPYVWSAVLGAGELNMGETITNLLPQPSDAQSGGAMVVSTRNSMFVLYGTSSADWKLVTYQRDVGSLAHTMQSIAANTYYLDDRGITNLTQTLNFGNFASDSISTSIREWLVTRKNNVIDSCVVKEKNQYRLFFGGGTGLHVTFAGAQLTGMMPIQYAHNIVAVYSGEFSDGTEGVFYGDDAGNVYLSDNGPSFAGDIITAYFKMQFAHCGQPRVLKRFKKVTFECGGGGYADFSVGTELGYSTYDVDTQPLEIVDVSFTGSRWDDPAQFWDSGVWDGRILLPVEVPLSGTEENIGITVYQSSNIYLGLNFQSALLQYMLRRQKR